MTTPEREKIDVIVGQLRAMLAAPKFGTSDQHSKLEDIADELELLVLDSENGNSVG